MGVWGRSPHNYNPLPAGRGQGEGRAYKCKSLPQGCFFCLSFYKELTSDYKCVTIESHAFGVQKMNKM